MKDAQPKDAPEDAKLLANLKRMILTANAAAERKGYLHGEIELGAIARVMDARSIVSVPLGVERGNRRLLRANDRAETILLM